MSMFIRKMMYKFIVSKFFREGKILDVAAGEGQFSDFCRSLGRDVTSIDIEPSKDYIKKWDVTKKGFVKKFGKYDNLFCSQIIEHFKNDELIDFIDEVCSKRVVIITQIESKNFWCHDNIPEYKLKNGHKKAYTLTELDYKMERLGFKSIFKFRGIKIKHLDSLMWVGERISASAV